MYNLRGEIVLNVQKGYILVQVDHCGMFIIVVTLYGLDRAVNFDLKRSDSPGQTKAYALLK